jgi:hypothetical protein
MASRKTQGGPAPDEQHRGDLSVVDGPAAGDLKPGEDTIAGLDCATGMMVRSGSGAGGGEEDDGEIEHWLGWVEAAAVVEEPASTEIRNARLIEVR